MALKTASGTGSEPLTWVCTPLLFRKPSRSGETPEPFSSWSSSVSSSISCSRLSITARMLGTSFSCSSVTGSTVAIFSTVFERSVNASALSGLVPDCATVSALFVKVVSSMNLITVSVVVSCGMRSATTGRRWALITTWLVRLFGAAKPAEVLMVVLASRAP